MILSLIGFSDLQDFSSSNTPHILWAYNHCLLESKAGLERNSLAIKKYDKFILKIMLLRVKYTKRKKHIFHFFPILNFVIAATLQGSIKFIFMSSKLY